MKMILTNVYVWDDTISLDSEWIYNVSGGKETSYKGKALLTTETYEELKEVSNIEFDYKYFDSLRENLQDDEADEYVTENCKDVLIGHKDYFIYNEEDLKDVIDYIGNVEIVRI